MGMMRSRWAAIGAAVAVSLGAGGLSLVSAARDAGARPTLTSITACRLVDTRPGFQVGPRGAPLGNNDTYTVSAHGNNGQCTGIPSDAVALSLNVTTTDATLETFLTFWDEGTLPNASSLNPAPGQPPTPNAVTVPLTSSGEFNVYNLQGSVQLIIDVTGYYQDHTHDDRYYTETEIDGMLAGLTPHLIDFIPDAGTEWLLFPSWFHNSSAGDECVRAPLRPPAGATVERVELTYVTSSITDVAISVYSVATGPGPGVVSQRLRRHLVDERSIPSSSNDFVTIEITDDPTDIFAGSVQPVPASGFDTLVTLCTSDIFQFSQLTLVVS